MSKTKTSEHRRSVMVHMDMDLFRRFERARRAVMPEVHEWMSAFGRQLISDALDSFERQHSTRKS